MGNSEKRMKCFKCAVTYVYDIFWMIINVVAEKEGFEPSVSLHLHALSRGADSANSPTSPCVSWVRL